MDGIQLKLKRTKEGVFATEIAELTGVSATRIYTLEGARRVSPEWTRRYLGALDKLTHSKRQEARV